MEEPAAEQPTDLAAHEAQFSQAAPEEPSQAEQQEGLAEQEEQSPEQESTAPEPQDDAAQPAYNDSQADQAAPLSEEAYAQEEQPAAEQEASMEESAYDDPAQHQHAAPEQVEGEVSGQEGSAQVDGEESGPVAQPSYRAAYKPAETFSEVLDSLQGEDAGKERGDRSAVWTAWLHLVLDPATCNPVAVAYSTENAAQSSGSCTDTVASPACSCRSEPLPACCCSCSS